MACIKREQPYNLDPVFERQVVTLACSNMRFYTRIGHVLDPELFKIESAKHAMRAAHAIFKDVGHGPDKSVLVIQRLRSWMADGKLTIEAVKLVAEMFDAAEDAGLPVVETAIAELAPIIQQRIRDEAVQVAIDSFGKKQDLSRAVALEKKAQAIGAAPASDDPIVRRLSDVKRESVSWLWPGRIPFGKLTVVDGDPGLGKSTMLSADIAARVSTGAPMPGDPTHTGRRPEDTIILSAEDSAADTIRPRLEAADADLTRVHVVDPSKLVIPDDIPMLEALISEKRAKLVIIDPLMAYLGGRIDAYRDQDVRRVMRALSSMAERTGAAVVVVRHLNKRDDVNALYRGGGSIGIIGAARSGLLVAKDPEMDGARVLASVKSNLGPAPTSLRFRLESDPVHDCGRVEWLGDSELTADALVGPAKAEDGDGRRVLDEAVGVLRQILRDGPVEAEKAKAEAEEAGVSGATLRRARAVLNVRPQKASMTGSWSWSLPDPTSSDSP